MTRVDRRCSLVVLPALRLHWMPPASWAQRSNDCLSRFRCEKCTGAEMALDDAELRGDAEQLGDELCLSDHVIRSYPSHSTFSHHLHRFNPAESSPRSAHGTVAFGEPRSPFYVAVILLDSP